jgi:hypothetical protein
MDIRSKAVSRSDFNTNNAWGFGGGFGVEYVFPNGSRLRIGTACYRHAPSHSFVAAYDASGRRVFDVSGGLSAAREAEIIKLLNL